MKSKLIYIFFVVLITAGSCGQKRTVRMYEEVTINPDRPVMSNPHAGMMMNKGMGPMSQDPAMQAMLSQSVADINLIWTTPPGWNEQKGTGMRLATFSTTGDEPVECSLVSLSGASGGLEANVKRWLGQISLELSESEFNQFMSAQKEIISEGQLKIRLVDFRTVYPFKEDNRPSIFAGILEMDRQTVFIKLTGTLKAINLNETQFLDFLKSLKLKDR